MDRYLEVNRTNLKLSRIGFGTANAGLAWDGDDSIRMFERYLERGGNVVDTARIYSDWVKPEVGRSERVIGDWIRRRGHHDDFVIMTKGGHPRMDSMNVSRLSDEELESDLNLSLRALSIDCIDVYCFHRDDTSRPAEELIETMEDFVRDGKIKYYACSNWSTERMKEADAYCMEKGYRGFVINQALYNYGSMGMKPFPDKTMVTVDHDMLEYHAMNTDRVLAPYMSQCSGFFNKLDKEGESATAESPYHTEHNLILYKRVKAIAQYLQTGITQALLGFLLTREPKMLPLIGARNMEQLDAAMDSLEIDFTGVSF